MEENYMATTRNGHEQKDMYNPETNTLDIRWISSDLSYVRHSKQAFSVLAYRKGSNGLYPPMCSAICVATVSLFLQYYNQVIHFSGEHRMDDKVIEDVLVPLIYRCVAK